MFLKIPECWKYIYWFRNVQISIILIHALIFLDFFNRSSNPDVLKLLNQLNGKPNDPINLQNVDPYMYSYDIRKVLEYYEQR